MEGYSYDEYQRQPLIYMVKAEDESTTNNNHHAIDTIIIHFRSRIIIEELVPVSEVEHHSFRRQELPLITKHALVSNYPDVFVTENTYMVIKQQVRGSFFMISDHWCEYIIRLLLSGLEYIVQSVVYPRHNVLGVNVDLCLEIVRIARIHHQQLSVPRFVPATDSSINSLEIKKIGRSVYDEGATCTICLEDFPLGDYAASMPCSHLFHETCIREWLNTSHYCPICRFEMPSAYSSP